MQFPTETQDRHSGKFRSSGGARSLAVCTRPSEHVPPLLTGWLSPPVPLPGQTDSSGDPVMATALRTEPKVGPQMEWHISQALPSPFQRTMEKPWHCLTGH